LQPHCQCGAITDEHLRQQRLDQRIIANHCNVRDLRSQLMATHLLGQVAAFLLQRWREVHDVAASIPEVKGHRRLVEVNQQGFCVPLSQRPCCPPPDQQHLDF